jgi:hypothetical protein
MQGIGAGTYRDCLWTVKGLLIPVDHEGIDLALRPGVSGFPDDMFDNRWIRSIHRRLRKIESTMGEQYFDDSWPVRFNINRVPLGLDVDKVDDEKIRKRIADGRQGLTRFLPCAVEPLNIGSNIGLMKILKQLTDEESLIDVSQRQYKVIVSDCNIFNRIIKV